MRTLLKIIFTLVAIACIGLVGFYIYATVNHTSMAQEALKTYIASTTNDSASSAETSSKAKEIASKLGVNLDDNDQVNTVIAANINKASDVKSVYEKVKNGEMTEDEAVAYLKKDLDLSSVSQ